MRKPVPDKVSDRASADIVVADRRMSFAFPGLVLAGVALVCATLTLFVLLISLIATALCNEWSNAL